MSKNTKTSLAKFLSLLERVLPRQVADTEQAARIYEGVAIEARIATSLEAFEKFCEKGSMPDAEEETLVSFKEQLEGNFGKGKITVRPPDEERVEISVGITLPDRIVTGLIKVIPPGEESGEPEAPFVPYPVAMRSDPELVWILARKENLGPDEAALALFNIEREFWASKKGQTLQRKGVERSFAEFISNVPASALKERGLKRYHKDPETLFLIKK